MNKKILLSSGIIVFAVAAVLGATGAFFNDTETSTGNTFTAGAIDLKVDSQSHYDGLLCTEVTAGIYQWKDDPADATPTSRPELLNQPCDGTWTLTDLANGVQHFWNFLDVKPGDDGENTISLHIDSNPAWACIDVDLTANDDVDCTEPENGAEGAGICNTDGAPLFDGELAQNLNFTAWADDGDNIWETGEPLLFSNISGPASDVLGGKTYTLADSTTGTPLPGGTTSYIGLAWCAGTQTVTLPNIITCDGAGMGNDTQTDSMTANVTFRVEQFRNNPDFLCDDDEEEEVPTATVTLDKIVTFTSNAILGVDVSDYTLHLVGPGGDHILVDQVAFPGLTPGAYVVSEVYSGNPANVTSNATFSGSCTEIGTSDTATFNVVAGVNPTCTITNSVTENLQG